MSLLSMILTFFGCNRIPESNEGEIEMIDSNNILMTVSTIENSLPGTNGLSKDSLDLNLLEDDWRQIEFISKKHEAKVIQELDSINYIIDNESVEVGEDMFAFKDLHVRKLIPNPLDVGLTLNEFQSYFSSFKSGSLSFNQIGKVNNGIYFNLSNFQLYGLVDDSKITVLGFYGLTSWENLKVFNAEIKNMMSKYDLILVDWRARKIINKDEFSSYLIPSE